MRDSGEKGFVGLVSTEALTVRGNKQNQRMIKNVVVVGVTDWFVCLYVMDFS